MTKSQSEEQAVYIDFLSSFELWSLNIDLWKISSADF